ncbi:CHAT domain-containing protein [Pseudanabaena sp. SR411]|uniref:CHAT domain-containing protein n=1 Tax=Pseudanabaena sp. SR411 TaxID=1980935 RepID=UPI001594EC2E|nr:CHAT domain-containing protein [Pseudanabaena sp. SR411]
MKRLSQSFTKTRITRFLIKIRLRIAFIKNLGLVFLLFFLTVFIQPMLANTITSPKSSQIVQVNSEQPNTLFNRGKSFYQLGQWQEAIQAWEQAIKLYQQQNNSLDLAITFSNLSLAHQKLGQWQEAESTIAQSLQIARSLEVNPASQSAIAQALDTQGNLYLSLGKIEEAIAVWQEAAILHAKLGNLDNQIRNVLNQAQAFKVQGFYRRSLQTLESIQALLPKISDDLLTAISLHNYGDMLTTVGDLKLAHQPLDKSWAILERINNNEQKSIVLLRQGNLARLEGNPEKAAEFYKNSAQVAGRSLTNLQAQLNLFSLLIDSNDWQEAVEMRSQIALLLSNLETSREAIFVRINYGESLLRLTKLVPQTVADSLLAEAAKILAVSVQQAKSINDSRTIAYAIGSLGNAYEQSKQIEESQKLTQQALVIAQSINATDIAYRWQWQLGRLLKAKGDIKGAILAYTEAVNGLRQLRSDLVFVNPNVQFSFRETVEPVYRQLVSLLLQDDTGDKQNNLIKAQAAIESLQIAELVNFFRSDCLNAAQVDINQIDRTAAVIYPIILEDRLEVILSLPNQPLRHYASNVTAAEIDDMVIDLRLNLRDPSSQDYLSNAQRIYDWLIRPATGAIAQSHVKTIIFVLDGSLRNIPMSVLHDGKQFLVENYSIALTPSLQLLDPKPIAKQKVIALIAGLTEARQGFSALPNVKDELQEINKQVPLSSIFLDASFTKQNLTKTLTSLTFPIIHLATHGNFSSEAENTYLLTYDGKLTIENLYQLLRSKNRSDLEPIELLILSACQTAVGDKRAALGLAGMAVRAGARSTIASLWSVDDEATSKFMIALYQSLSSANVTRAESLRLAQQSLLKNEKYDHPYYWSPFVLLGNWL